jgi:hypothetical protein
VTGPLEASGGDVDLDVLRLLLRTNAATLDERLARVQNKRGEIGGAEGSPIAAIAAATSLEAVLDDIVVCLVRQARDEGQSWAAIGYALQVSRQAAFQRFGSRTGERLAPAETILADAPERAVQALGQFLSGDFDALRDTFNERMTEACTLGLLESVRSRIATQLGGLSRLGTPTMSSEPGYSVVEIPIFFAKGQRKSRIAYDPDGRIAGFFVITTDTF